MAGKALISEDSHDPTENLASRRQISGHYVRLADSIATLSAAWSVRLVPLLKLILMLCLVLVPASAFADRPGWENLNQLAAGNKIQVEDSNHKKLTGTFIEYSNAGISLQTSAGAQTVRKEDVRAVKLMENHHRLRNAGIGAAVGAGVGAGIGAASYQKCTSTKFLACLGDDGRGLNTGLGAVLGGIGGAAVGALWPDHKTLYRSSAR
jgi:hypothetical protein